MTEDKYIPLHVEHLVLLKSFPISYFYGVPRSPAIHLDIKFYKSTTHYKVCELVRTAAIEWQSVRLSKILQYLQHLRAIVEVQEKLVCKTDSFFDILCIRTKYLVFNLYFFPERYVSNDVIFTVNINLSVHY